MNDDIKEIYDKVIRDPDLLDEIIGSCPRFTEPAL